MPVAGRADAIRWAASMARRADVLYLDTETTGIRAGSEIVDVAVIDGDGRILLDTLVRPLRPIPRDATAIHGISDRMVASAPTWPDVCAQLHDLLSNRSCIIYNAEFDRRMLDGSCRDHRLSLLSADWHCAMLRYAAFVGDWNHRHGNYRWHKLDVASRAVGSPIPPTHRALADAQACRAVVKAMATTQVA